MPVAELEATESLYNVLRSPRIKKGCFRETDRVIINKTCFSLIAQWKYKQSMISID